MLRSKKCFASLFSSILIIGLAVADQSDTVFRWSSTGGGWRSMFACVGFANIFHRAGLFTEDSSLFSAISTTSGASWFSTQLFYSQAFYDQTALAPTPEHLYNFTLTWMGAYEAFARQVVKPNETSMSNALGVNITVLQGAAAEWVELEFNPVTYMSEFWGLYDAVNQSWANFVQEMLTRASRDYGHDSQDFSDLVANSENRIPALRATDLLVQAALAPTAKVRLGSSVTNVTQQLVEYLEQEDFEALNASTKWAWLAPLFGDIRNQDLQVYLGPLLKDDVTGTVDPWPLFSVAISAAYVVNDTFAGFQYNTFDSPSSRELATYASPTSRIFDWKDWQGYYIWPNKRGLGWPTDNASHVVDSSLVQTFHAGASNMTPTGPMAMPFGGRAASVIQAAAISSAAAAGFSPAVPSVFAQSMSKQRQEAVRESMEANKNNSALTVVLGLTAFDVASKEVYKNALLDNAAVCSQWPNDCQPGDGYFMDGGFADNPAVAINVAQYHQSGGNLSKTMKLVMTNTNEEYRPNSFDTDWVLQYFDCEFNSGISPGDFVWLPSYYVPYRSPQIFAEKLTVEELVNAMEPLEGSQMTSAVLKGTTVDNPAFGVKAGQAVEVLILNVNEPITTFILGETIIGKATPRLANMTRNIAANQALLARVQDFFGTTSSPDSNTLESSANDEGGEDDVDTNVERGAGDMDYRSQKDVDVGTRQFTSEATLSRNQRYLSLVAQTLFCLAVCLVAW